MLLFNKALCRVRPRQRTSGAKEEQACFVEVYRQFHLGGGVLSQLATAADGHGIHVTSSEIWEIHANPSKAELHWRWQPNSISKGSARERHAAAMSRPVILRDSYIFQQGRHQHRSPNSTGKRRRGYTEGLFRGTVEVHASDTAPGGARLDVPKFDACPILRRAKPLITMARSCQPFLGALAAVSISLSPAHIGHQGPPNATLQPGGPLRA